MCLAVPDACQALQSPVSRCDHELLVSCTFTARFSLGRQHQTMTTAVAPTTQSSPAAMPPSVFTLPHTAQLEALYTIIRDKNTSRGDFLFYSDRIIRLLVEEGLNHLPVVAKTVETPTVGQGTFINQYARCADNVHV